MTIRRCRTIGGPKTIDAINSSGACDTRNVPSRWCIGRSSCLNRSSAPEKRRLKLRGHNGGASKRVNADTIPGNERDAAKGTSDVARLEEDGTARGYGLICGVSFSRLLSNCALAPVASAWHGFPYTGCSTKVRIELGNRVLWRTRDRFFATFESLIWVKWDSGTRVKKTDSLSVAFSPQI